MQHFYASYSALALSNISDRAKAVAGLQQHIARTFRSDATHGVLWEWPERTLLWRAAEPGALTRIDYHHCATQPPPSWSWMAYKGRIDFLEVPFAGVKWAGNVQREPAGPERQEERLRAKAHGLRIDGAELMRRGVLDVQDVKFVQDCWKCVLVGTRRVGGEDAGAAQYVLLIRPKSGSPSSQPDNMYERVGVATLLASHFLDEERSVFIV